ncbi:MAG: hypothetical protein KF746_02310 [Chitinophagaceae bacterium]|nr:hypothetical protein [Chitinophagaceae bacterium]
MRFSTPSFTFLVSPIIQQQHHSTNANVMIKDYQQPEGNYALLTLDTINNILIRATGYRYIGKFKYLTNYFYWNEKLIATQTTRCLIRNQEQNSNWEQYCTYWNDSLLKKRVTKGVGFNKEKELEKAYEILRTYKALSQTKKPVFRSVGAWGELTIGRQ